MSRIIELSRCVLLSCVIFVATCVCAYSQSPLTVEINSGSVQKMSVALPMLLSSDPTATNTATELTKVIYDDLINSGLFHIPDPKSYLENINSIEQGPNFEVWKRINAQALLVADVTIEGSEIVAKYRLWDVVTSRQLAGREYRAPYQNMRRVGHMLADDIYERLTGESGYFDSRIIYIAESGDPRNPTKRLAIMDQDGANHKYLTSGQYKVITPRFDPNSQRIVYVGYYGDNKPTIYVFDLETGQEYSLGQFDGMSFAQRFSYDGSKIAISISKQGNSEIYVLDSRGGNMRQLTNNPAIDTSPSFSPDNSKIVFNSDRGGSPQLYVMNIDGTDQKRISFGNGTYTTPVWSPKGDWIAFTNISGGQFHIGVMRPDGSNEKLLTTSFLDEGPSWAPNGRAIMFARSKPSTNISAGTSSLYIIDRNGGNLRRLKVAKNATDPAWSPLLSKK